MRACMHCMCTCMLVCTCVCVCLCQVLAGEDNLRTTVRENGARFELDYRDVYWNSRLETEHKRIVDLLPEDAIVADM